MSEPITPDSGGVMPPDAAREAVLEGAARRAHQEHFFAALDEQPLLAIDEPKDGAPPSGMWRDAWRQMRRRPMFWISATLIVLVVTVALFPHLFTSTDPEDFDLSRSLDGPAPGHPWGFTFQGYDVYARVIYGARPSVAVGLITTFGVILIGGTIGALAGFFGSWWDALLSRVTDIFFAIPLVLAAITVIQLFPARNVLTVAVVLIIFGWPQLSRITRGSVISVRNSEFVTASRALGSSRGGILARHVLPNALAPIIVTATVSLGIFIVAEATLSFLGIGLPTSVVSWGADISTAQKSLRDQPMVLFYPAAALATTVLSFILMGDVVRDALDPKARKR